MMEELIITGVCVAIALAFWLLLVTDREKQKQNPSVPPFQPGGPGVVLTLTTQDREQMREERRRVRQAMKAALAEQDQDHQCRCIDDGSGRGGVARSFFTGIALLACLFIVGCGAREHRDNLAEVVRLQKVVDDKEAADEKRRKEALAEIALEQREARKEVQDSKRTIQQTLAEIEGGD